MPDIDLLPAEVEQLLVDLFLADHEYGCGFYNDERWLAAYKSLRQLVKHRLPPSTGLFDA